MEACKFLRVISQYVKTWASSLYYLEGKPNAPSSALDYTLPQPQRGQGGAFMQVRAGFRGTRKCLLEPEIGL